jgi:peptide subunit release factor 1 (eRF1)
MANQAWYGNTPYVRPLLEALEEYERYGVVLVDRERARFFIISMGDIEEVSDVFQEPPVKHRATSGRDHMRSQMIFQRRAAKWSESFLKDVSDILHDIITRYDIDRIILGGPEEVSAEMHRLLPQAVAARVSARVKLSMTAKAEEVLDVSSTVIERFDREQERFIVGDLITIAKKANPTFEKAVVGLNPTLDAVNQGRVHRLVYPSGLKLKGYRCSFCDVFLDHAPRDGICPYCSNTLEEVEDIIWQISERVLSTGGKIEEIRDDEARSRLMSAGNIGASLR